MQSDRGIGIRDSEGHGFGRNDRHPEVKLHCAVRTAAVNIQRRAEFFHRLVCLRRLGISRIIDLRGVLDNITALVHAQNSVCSDRLDDRIVKRFKRIEHCIRLFGSAVMNDVFRLNIGHFIHVERNTAFAVNVGRIGSAPVILDDEGKTGSRAAF